MSDSVQSLASEPLEIQKDGLAWLTGLRTNPRRRRDIPQRCGIESPIAVDKRPNLLAQQRLIGLDAVPEGIIRCPKIVVHDLVGAKAWLRVLMARVTAAELPFEALGHHCELPGPDYRAVVGARCPVAGVDFVGAEGRVGDEHADGSVEAGGECAADVGGGLVDEGGELLLVGCVQEEVAEAVVRVHDLDLREVIVAIEGEGMEDDVGVD